MSSPFEGGCRCRAVRYRCTAEPLLVVHCHCRDCQYASGGECTTAAVVPAESVTVEGAPVAYTTTADSGTEVTRLFCGTCGSPVFARNAAASMSLAIKAASLDDPSWLTIVPRTHIWTRSAQPWARLADDVRKYPGNFGMD